MPYCIKCGTQLPTDEAAKFCPNCGAAIVPTIRHRQTLVTTKEPYESLEIATTRNRVLLMLVTLVLCFAITSAGALEQIEFSEANNITQEFQTFQGMLKAVGLQIIFGNNLMHCLFMFIPGIGPFYGFYVLYSTGKVLAATGLMMGENPLLLFISLFIYPYAWLEYVSYSLAVSESLWLIHAARKYQIKGFRYELSTAAKVIAFCAILLLIAAIAEMNVVSSALS
jgi:predicted RNA-binding Zn-ribbon protein involved in translation (DUF1610 family)